MLLKTTDDILNYFTFTTPRLSLKPVDHTTLPFLAKLYGCSNTMHYIAAPFSYVQTAAMLNTMLRKQKQQQCDSLILLLKNKNSLIEYGISGMPYIDFVNKKAEIGVILLLKFQNIGVALEVMRAIVAKLIALEIKTIYMQISPTNKAAILLASKLGFIANTEKTRYIYQYVVNTKDNKILKG